MTQAQAVIETIDMLGGIATLNQINQHIFEITDCQWRTKTPFASVRRIVQQTVGIYKIKPGLYALETHRQALENNGILVQNEHNQDSDAIKTFNHAYYQGLLLEMGKMRHLDTFVPDQDKHKQFLNQAELGDLRTIQVLPEYSFPQLVKRSSTIDVIWFNDRHMPHSFFEVEHSTDIQNSLLKFNDLQDFAARMVIVADEKRHHEFISKMGYAAFRQLASNKRVAFLSYESLGKQYEQEFEKQKFEFVI
ncbi:MAG: hypothetical protein IJ169_00130 [Paludibacteraceae bacterium]|nr:hypothetical protein [Paludibacteraceae bacterium]